MRNFIVVILLLLIVNLPRIEFMTSRIAYRNNGDGTYTSKSPIVAKNGAVYSVTIDRPALSYKIKNLERNNVVKSGSSKESYVYLLRLIKKDLEKLGVEFKIEVRRLGNE